MTKISHEDVLHGYMAEFEHAEELVEAAHKARHEGYTKMDAYSPIPVEGLSEAIGFERTGIAQICLAGGILGGLTGYLLQFYTAAVTYPLNIGGRPINDIPTDIPVIYELTILFAALSAAIGMLFLNGFPQPYHPVFNVERFGQATRDRFFLVIETGDPKFDKEGTKKFLKALKPHGVYDVER